MSTALRLVLGRLRHIRIAEGSSAGTAEKFALIADRLLRKLDERPDRSNDWDLYEASLNEEGFSSDFLAEDGITKTFVCSSLVADAYFATMKRRSPLLLAVDGFAFPLPTPADIYLNPKLVDLVETEISQSASVIQLRR